MRYVLLALFITILLSSCDFLADALPPTPSPFPTLARLPTVTPEPPTSIPRPTNTPTPNQPTPLAGPLEATVAVSANLRDGPGTEYDIVAILPVGASLVLQKKQGDWVHVKTQDDVQGWMALEVLNVDDDIVKAVPTSSP